MLKNFKYVKDNEEVTDRVVLVLSNPSKNMFGLDISNISQEEKDVIILDFKNMKALQKEIFDDFVMKYNLGSRYRSFKEEGIVTDV